MSALLPVILVIHFLTVVKVTCCRVWKVILKAYIDRQPFTLTFIYYG